MVQISLILPCYNSRVLAESNLPVLSSFLASSFQSHEIIVVDDGSEGDERLSADTLPETVRLICLDNNYGKGRAVREGMLAAKGECIVFTDIDLPYDLSAITEAFNLVTTQDTDFVPGDRFHKLSTMPTKRNRIRRSASQVLRLSLNLILLNGCYDTQCGLKAFSRKWLTEITPMLTIDRFAFDIEIYYLVLQFQVPFQAIPVHCQPSHSTSVQLVRDALHVIRDALSIPLRWCRGEYHAQSRKETSQDSTKKCSAFSGGIEKKLRIIKNV